MDHWETLGEQPPVVIGEADALVALVAAREARGGGGVVYLSDQATRRSFAT